MTVFLKMVTSIIFFFFLFTSPSTGEIKSIKIQSDYRPMILFDKFGFTHTGFISVSVSNVSVTSTPDRQGFFLVSQQSLIQLIHQLQQITYNFCVLDSKFIILLFNFRDLSHSSIHVSYPVTLTSEYSLLFANCNAESLITMDARTQMFNSDDGITKDYLSVGLTQLPSLYFIFTLIYLCFLAFWISMWLKNQQSVHLIHLLMSVLLVTKAISLICVTIDKHHVKVTGTHNVWHVLFYLFHFINVVILFSTMVWIGSVQPYLKSFLLRKEKKVLMIVILLQILANVAYIVIDKTGPYIEYWVAWNQMFLLMDFVSCCAVIFRIVWSIRSFSKADRKADRNQTMFRLLGVMVVCYLLFTRIGVFALKTIVDYKQQWVCYAAEELASLVLYLVAFYMFKPVKEDKYSDVDDNKGLYEEAPEMAKG